MKILANDGIEKSARETLEKAGFQVSADKVEQSELAGSINLNGYSALLVRSATQVKKDIIDACPGLKLIGRGGVGMDNIDVEYAKSKRIKVINTPAASSQSVAELVMAHMFDMSRFLYDSNRLMPQQGATKFNELKKKYSKGIELRKKTLGIIGFGRIGQSLATYALGCGMKVIAFDPFVSIGTIDIMIEGLGNVSITIKTVSFHEVITKSDYISLHVPKQKDGKPVISKIEFDNMKNGVCLVNASRGGVMDEHALMDALNSGKVAHAALDVFENEPAPMKELLSHPKISLTPHTGASTVEAQERIGAELAGQIIEFFKQ